MQRNYLKFKTGNSQIRLLQNTWHSVYQNSYDEGLKFLIKGLNLPIHSIDDVVEKIEKKIPTLPVTLADELDTNIFLRCDDMKIKNNLKMRNSSKFEVFTKLRNLKDQF